MDGHSHLLIKLNRCILKARGRTNEEVYILQSIPVDRAATAITQARKMPSAQKEPLSRDISLHAMLAKSVARTIQKAGRKKEFRVRGSTPYGIPHALGGK